ITPPTATAGTRLTTSAKGKQAAKASKAKSLYALTEDAKKDDEEEGGDDEEEYDEEIRDEESFDPIPKPLKTVMMKA
nr:hypothetical protein [Tanacetum cinerariifolium]